jgi:hypothetical protein
VEDDPAGVNSMSMIDRVVRELERFPAVKFRRSDGQMTVDSASPEGFKVAIQDHQNWFLVAYDGWHENFTNEELAMGCFINGLSPRVRLKVTRRAGRAYRWTLESRQGETWVAASTVAHLLIPFWKKAEVVYLQNHWIEASQGTT